ncbi:Transport ATP-binding protein CydD [Candidatus Hydrogenisulfobacillus filiaventi]|uniref:Transport ATP-binding protein CydD n=1 Tax=Candidatus Hydrogenisulfobacillus filiaventi TaxID=2707344 RepID=A0A6F8ZG61_9FIRM|nr:Transport ATP-binding protein CydD [Candidatus Hydrogenisulfobacillus filiaventi]
MDRRLWTRVKPARWLLAMVIGQGVLNGVLVVLQAWFMAQAVAQVYLGHRPLSAVSPDIYGLLAVVAARAVVAWGAERAGLAMAQRVQAEVRRQIMEAVVGRGPAAMTAGSGGDVAAIALDGVEALEDYLAHFLPQVVLSVAVPVLVGLAVLWQDPLSALILFVTAPLIPIFMVLIGRQAEATNRRQWELLSRLSAHFLDVLQGLTTLELFGRARRQEAIIADVSDRYRRATMKTLRIGFLSSLVLELSAALSTAIVAVVIGIRMVGGSLPFFPGFFVLLLAPEFFAPLRALGTNYHAGLSGRTALERIFGVLDQPVPEPGRRRPPEGAPLTVRLNHLSYAYGPGDPVLRDVSLFLPPGRHLAIVGPSGAGKSTLLSVLMGFVVPGPGQGEVAGVDLAELDGDWWRRQVAWVPQRPYLFAGTVADNIRLGVPDAPREAVEEAARLCRADAFIRALPQGYDTVIGERGLTLSGGEAQRIALARAVLKDAPVVLMDEPTANLDPETEGVLDELLERWRDRTVVVVAHRLNTVRHADWLLVMDGGRVVESGTPESLAQRPGLYRQLRIAYAEGVGS